MISEFDLIAKYFKRPAARADLGVGDDCALLRQTTGMQTAISTDMLVSGTHFFPDTDPEQLGHKALAVNLSDLAAMGATPTACTLAVAMQAPDESWIAAFAKGILTLADRYQCELIGGDTTRGPLNICITVFGQIPAGQALRRDGAKAGDDIWISGTIGDARLALAHLRQELTLPQDQFQQVLPRLQKPMPRVELGIALRNIAHAALDLSDGLLGDLGHILDASHAGAAINTDDLPISGILRQQDEKWRLQCTLGGGDDYELCFTAPVEKREQVLEAARLSHTPVTRIGSIDPQPGIRLYNAAGPLARTGIHSFDHFATPEK